MRTTSTPPRIPPALAAFDSLPDAANVDVTVVSQLFGCGVSTVWARLKRNDSIMPRPRKFGNSTRWNVGQLRAALAVGVQE